MSEEDSIVQNSVSQSSQKKPLVKVFRLDGNLWVEMGIGTITTELKDDSVEIDIKTNDEKVIIAVKLMKGDAYERQNEKVIQIQGKLFRHEYALSFLDKKLCSLLCDDLEKVGARLITDGPIKFCEENMMELRDLAIKALASRNTIELFEKVPLVDIANGLVDISKRISNETKKEVIDSIFVFVKVILLLLDEKIADELYKYPTLKALFVILSYDPTIPQSNRIYFLDDFKEKLSNMKEVIERSSTVKSIIEYAFGLTYFRDVVVARFSDDTIGTPLNMRLSNLHRKILEESIKDKTIQKCGEKYQTSDKETKRGIAITLKQICSHLVLYPPVQREERAKGVIDNEIIPIIKEGLKDENKGYFLDALVSLFESGSNIGMCLIEEGILQELSKSVINEKGSYLFGAFQLLQNCTFIIDGNIKYQNVLVEALLPSTMDILIDPILNKDKYDKNALGRYLERFSSFLVFLIKIPTTKLLPYLIQTQLFHKILKILNETTNCAKVNIVSSLKEICKLNYNEITRLLIDSGMVEILKDIKNELPGITLPAAEEILEMFRNRMSIEPKIENVVCGLVHLATEGIKRPIDEKEVVVLMEETTPTKKCIGETKINKPNEVFKEIKKIDELEPIKESDAKEVLNEDKKN